MKPDTNKNRKNRLVEKAIRWISTHPRTVASISSSALLTALASYYGGSLPGSLDITALAIAGTIAGSGTADLINYTRAPKKLKRSRHESGIDEELPNAKKQCLNSENILTMNQDILETVLDTDQDVEILLPENTEGQSQAASPLSDKDTYLVHIDELNNKAEERHAELREKQCITLGKKLSSILNKALDANFLDNGELASEQPPRNKLQCLRWSDKVLTHLLEMPRAERTKSFKQAIINKAIEKIETPSTNINNPKI